MEEVTYITESKFYEGTFPEIDRADVNLAQLKKNMDTIRSGIKPGIKFMAVVKGDAYGHGLNPIMIWLNAVSFYIGWKEVIVSGRKVPIVSYFMDGIMADITDVKEEVREFDEVVIVGRQGRKGRKAISWEKACHKINAYIDEQFQRITERVPKHYFYE